MRLCPKCARRFSDTISFCPDDGAHLRPITETGEVVDGQPIELDNRQVGPYRLDELIAEGGMGAIFESTHVALGRKVAFKMLRREFAANPRTVARFFREARAIAALRHEHIVDVIDFFENVGGDNFYVMELLEGQSLKELLLEEGALPVRRVLPIAIDIADALSAVHGTGIVHRDLKSENVFLTPRGGRPDFVKLIDFGIAKVIDQPLDEGVDHTIEGTVIGTPAYMSPEQASGQAVDYRTDIYALGVLLYECLVGRRPIGGHEFGEIVRNQLTQVPVPPSQIPEVTPLPPEFERLVMQCLEKEAAARPGSMTEVLERLRAIEAELQAAPTPQVPAQTAVRPGRGRALPAAAIFVTVLALAAVAAWLTLRPAAGSDPSVTEAPTDAGPPAPPPNLKLAALPEVRIALSSEPAGADVFRPGQPESLGQTPLTLSLPRTDDVIVFELRLARHLPARARISLDKDSRVRVVLPPLAARRPDTPRPPPPDTSPGIGPKPPNPVPPPPDPNATLNPFGP